MKYILGCLMVFLLAGWASKSDHGYSRYYDPAPGETPEIVAATRAGPAPAVPALLRSAVKPDLSEYARRGYSPVGVSYFSSGYTESDDDALQQGAKVGADVVVIVSSTFEGTKTVQHESTVPTSTTSYTNDSATAYGNGVSVSAYGNSTTTTHGQRTTHEQLSADRYVYAAVYFVKRKFSFGAYGRDLNDGERQALQTNKGAYVEMVVNETPAFRSDILPGDIILELNGQSVDGGASLGQLIGANVGTEIELRISRRGHEVIKRVQLAK